MSQWRDRPGPWMADAMSTRAVGSGLHLGPTSRWGRWSLVLLVLSATAWGVMALMVSLGERGGDTLADNWLLSGPFLVAASCGVVGAVAGLVGVARDRERGLLAALPIAFGLLLAAFLAGEVLAPH